MKINTRMLMTLVMGALFSILAWFMVQTLYAQILLDYVIGSFGDDAYLNILFIFLIGELIAFGLSIIISFLVIQDIKRVALIQACILGFISNLLFWFMFSFLTIFILYPEVFSNIIGYEILIISPIIVMYFGIYVLNDITRIWLLTQISYWIFFGLFLVLFSNQKRIKKRKTYYIGVNEIVQKKRRKPN